MEDRRRPERRPAGVHQETRRAPVWWAMRHSLMRRAMLFQILLPISLANTMFPPPAVTPDIPLCSLMAIAKGYIAHINTVVVVTEGSPVGWIFVVWRVLMLHYW